MNWHLSFHSLAIREFQKLDNGVKAQFLLRLEKLLFEQAGPGSELIGALAGCNKIKLRKDGYRLVYFRDYRRMSIRVIAVGRRDQKIYEKAATRLNLES